MFYAPNTPLLPLHEPPITRPGYEHPARARGVAAADPTASAGRTAEPRAAEGGRSRPGLCVPLSAGSAELLRDDVGGKHGVGV